MGRDAMRIGSGHASFRVALLALALAIATVAGARADSGGAGARSDRSQGDCSRVDFGKRVLERRDCGNDVRTLNWILKSKDYGVRLRRSFNKSTERSVRAFQRKKAIASDGIVGDRTRDELVRSMRRHKASWYGPGFWGNRTACGQRLRKRTVGVAHRNLPCGTRVVIGHGGRYVRTRVIDRGPFVKRNYERDWDLTRAAARKIGFEGVDRVRAAPIR